MKNLSAEVVMSTLIFLAMFVFFSQVHPIVLFDGDDWNVISDARVGLPKWHGWNPIKILPETFFPICGYFAAYVVRPIIGDYLTAFTLTAALIVSIFITAYVCLFVKFIKAIFNFDKFTASIFGMMFLLLHFAIFLKHNTQDNLYLFHTTDADCYFNYVLPNLLNATLVLFVARVDLTRKFFDRMTPFAITLFFVLYLAIFSNVLSSCVLAIYVFVELMSRVKPKEFNLRKFFAANRTLCIFLIFWLISLLFEANGGRAQSMAHEESYILLVLYTAAALIQSLLLDNRGLALIIFAIVTLPFMWRANKDLWRVTKKFLLCLPLWTVYIILVTARAEATYALRPDVQFGFFFIVFVIFLTALGFWIKKFPRAALVLPILCFALFTWIFSGKRTFCPSTFNHVPESVCIQVSQHIMNQIIAADRAGFKEVTITVPKGDDVDNYPHPLYMGNNISRTLHAHGMISRRLEVKVQPDATLNERFNLP
ncbi:MAG: hypothetical protein IKD73_06235 [Selenomonadaceae bacterium]|nr:hypothetical protein [Selenomonadaceae bacterium]